MKNQTYCPQCGSKNESGFKFCFSCGIELPKIENDTPKISVNKLEEYKYKEQYNNSIPTGIIMVAILNFFSSVIWFTFSFFILPILSVFVGYAVSILAIWNIAMSVIRIGIGIAILKKEKWGYNWGIWSAIIGIIWYGFCSLKGDTIFFYIWFFFLVEIGILILLYMNRKCFMLDNSNLPQKLQNVTLDLRELPKSDVDIEFKQKLIKLEDLIKTEKKSLFGSNNKSEIIVLMNELCTSKPAANKLLSNYVQLSGKELVEEIKKLTSSYEGMKEYLWQLIELEIIEGKYPHEKINVQ